MLTRRTFLEAIGLGALVGALPVAYAAGKQHGQKVAPYTEKLHIQDLDELPPFNVKWVNLEKLQRHQFDEPEWGVMEPVERAPIAVVSCKVAPGIEKWKGWTNT